jgi:diadenosine tetraphosphate (Ap4A) HIT family hydrolase
MHPKLPKPLSKAIIYQDSFLYACLATHPIARGHVVVVWKKNVTDLRRLTDRDYDFLMDTVRAVRDAMIKVLKISKVYLIYLDEARQVHWQLVPRYNEKGYNVFLHQPKKITDFSLAQKIKQQLKFR